MARRVLAVRRGEAQAIPAGNVSVGRDLSDVRDVVRAYRLLIEAVAAGRLHERCMVVNVASGTTVSIRWVIERLCELAGVAARIKIDPSLVRQGEAKEIRGDRSLLTQLTHWEPKIPIEQTLADVFADAESSLTSS
jgi:GDP-4-dehydro-6-deoxy-D-mannose reductase